MVRSKAFELATLDRLRQTIRWNTDEEVNDPDTSMWTGFLDGEGPPEFHLVG